MKLDAHAIHAAILAAAERQLATTPEAAAIFAAGLGDQLRSLIHAISANAAQPLACDVEDAIDAARA